ncbi:MAG: glycine cleavage system protein H [Propioniciclava sp.]|uniref:glycine cleavage system protein H n=1 Tax=Propioniciclava sp. TaxID=2038686 RepID=UPI0039E22E29
MAETNPAPIPGFEHLWIVIENGVATVGITQETADAAGDFIFVELPEVGRRVRAGEPLGSVETTKSIVDIASPLTAVVAEVNAELGEHPRLLNDDPYRSGWIVRLRRES